MTDSHLHSDILDLVERQAEWRPDLIAIEDAADLKLTFRELAETVRDFARSLTDFGVTRTSRVAVVLPNGPGIAITLLSVASTAVVVPLNPRYLADEYRSYFETIRVDYLIVPAGGGPVAREVAAEMGIAVLELCEVDGFTLQATDEKLAARPGAEVPFAPPQPGDIAAILMTSGSTGRSKKVPLTHRNICVATRNIGLTLDVKPGDRSLCVVEQFHVSGLTVMLTLPLSLGCTVICTKGFDAVEFFDLLERKKPTWFEAVPSMLHELAVHAQRFPVGNKLHSLAFIRSGAAGLDPALMFKTEELMGTRIMQSYGMTEAAPFVCSTPLDPETRKPGSSGIPTTTEVRVLGPDGAVLPTGELGEMALRGDNIFAGYEDDPENNAETFVDGWFRTGDLGHIDEDGHVFLKGRVKHMINRAGEKVNPQEIDDVLLAHPAVTGAAAFPVAHPTMGEDVAVAVVLETPGAVTEQELRDFVGERLIAFKVPRRVVFLSKIPRNPTGKIDRLALSEMAAAWAPPVAGTAPASNLEERIAAVWATELGLAQVGPDDNFFTIGGDSLSGVRLFLAVEKELGAPLPDRALVEITTVRDMAELIEGHEKEEFTAEEDAGAEELTETQKRSVAVVMGKGRIPVVRPGSAVKVLNAAGSRRPLYWVFNSPAEDMARLQPYLDPELPVYGFYSGGKLFERTEEMVRKVAAFHAAELLALQPEGPYLIGGDCHGARVAVALTRILEAAGHRIDKLCLLEHAEAGLADFDGQVLMMFGKQSRFMFYREIGWGGHGWRARFKKPPVMKWVSGPHGRSYHPAFVGSFLNTLESFLQDRPIESGPLARLEARIVMSIHRVPVFFKVYARTLGILERIVHGKPVKLDRITGEPIA